MKFEQRLESDVKKPIIIAVMQDMGNVGSIVINFINESLKIKTFRISKTPFPTYGRIKEDTLICQMNIRNANSLKI